MSIKLYHVSYLVLRLRLFGFASFPFSKFFFFLEGPFLFGSLPYMMQIFDDHVVLCGKHGTWGGGWLYSLAFGYGCFF